jgi:exonuclease III
MKKMNKYILIILVAILAYSCSKHNQENKVTTPAPSGNRTIINSDTINLKVFQFNIWHEGTKVNNGFEAIVDNIIQSKADFVCMSEVANYSNVDFISKLIKALKKKGETYYAQSSTNTGIISKFPIAKQTIVHSDLSNNSIVILKSTVNINKEQIVIYSAHLDYTHYSCYLPRGYSGVSWEKLPKPVLDLNEILKDNLASQRDEAIKAFITDAEKEYSKGNLVILGGDFNEPSHLDWKDDTKDLFDHNGMVIPWHTSISLHESGYVDAYRKKYENPVSHPGFTFPSDNKDKNTGDLTWAPEADERERIDFIYYYPDKTLSLEDIVVYGPNSSILRNKRVKEASEDVFILPNGTWPSDHKSVLATFNWVPKK